MIKTDKIIIVEGKYDVAAVKKVCDATVIKTDGFGIFKNKDLKSFIKKCAEKRGIVILTDSDKAGMVIRKHIEGIVSKEYITNIFLPRIDGKEKRKKTASKEGILGVEGVDSTILENTLLKMGIGSDNPNRNPDPITKTDLFLDGLTGSDNASEKRKKFMQLLGLPENLSPTKMLEALNLFITREDYEKTLQSIGNK